MTKKELIIGLKESHQKFVDHIDSLNKEEFEFSKNQKWTAGQNLAHLIKSTLPISKVLQDKAFITSKFGIIDRDLLTYEKLVTKYHLELKKGGKAPDKFVPDKINWTQKNELKDQLIKIVEKISTHLGLYSEEELSKLILPHPLMGALTIQEMMLFTIYHTGHHLESSLKNVTE